MVSASFLGSRGCRLAPIPLALGRDSDVSINLPANTPCTILVQTGSAVLDDIAINAPPERGTLTSRGRSGVVYRPLPGFKGNDSFDFSLHGLLNGMRGKLDCPGACGHRLDQLGLLSATSRLSDSDVGACRRRTSFPRQHDVSAESLVFVS